MFFSILLGPPSALPGRLGRLMAVYIFLRDCNADDAMDVEEGVIMDLDDKGHIVGIEILDAAERLGLESLLNISIENMPLDKAPTFIT